LEPAEFWGDPCYSRLLAFRVDQSPKYFFSSARAPEKAPGSASGGSVSIFCFHLFSFYFFPSIFFFHLFSRLSSTPKRGVLVQDKAMLRAQVFEPRNKPGIFHHGISESLRLAKTLKTIKSNRQPNTAMPATAINLFYIYIYFIYIAIKLL